MAYEDVALANAIDQKLTCTEVAAMGYSKIAELSDVELGPNGESPADFFYVQVRAFVVAELQALEAAQLEEDIMKDLEAAKRTYPRLAGLEVFKEEDGYSLK